MNYNFENVLEHTTQYSNEQLNLNNERSRLNNERRRLIQKIVCDNQLILLSCDYLGMDSYYYSKQKNLMYKVCNICDYTNNVNPTFEISYDKHIIELNKLPIKI
jgi:hypothetical protein